MTQSDFTFLAVMTYVYGAFALPGSVLQRAFWPIVAVIQAWAQVLQGPNR